MIIELTNNTIVRFEKGSVLEVSEEEGKRLIAFNNAVEKKTAPKKAAKKSKE